MPVIDVDDTAVRVLQLDTIPDSLFEEFVADCGRSNVLVRTEKRPNEPMASIAWYAMTALALYLAKPFVDAHLKRAADDVANVTYPAIKQALQRLVQRILHRSNLQLTVVTSHEDKVGDGYCLLFSIWSDTKFDRMVKFTFVEPLPEQELNSAVGQVLALLEEHQSRENEDDELSRRIRDVNPIPRIVVMTFDRTSGLWVADDPKSHRS